MFFPLVRVNPKGRGGRQDISGAAATVWIASTPWPTKTSPRSAEQKDVRAADMKAKDTELDKRRKCQHGLETIANKFKESSSFQLNYARDGNTNNDKILGKKHCQKTSLLLHVDPLSYHPAARKKGLSGHRLHVVP